MNSEPALKKYKVKEKNLKELESFLDIKDDETKEKNDLSRNYCEFYKCCRLSDLAAFVFLVEKST